MSFDRPDGACSPVEEAIRHTFAHIVVRKKGAGLPPLFPSPRRKGSRRVSASLPSHLEREPALLARIDVGLRDLDAPAFPKRSAASQAIVAMGLFAATVLRGELSQKPSLEMRHRIAEMVNQIDAGDVQSPTRGRTGSERGFLSDDQPGFEVARSRRLPRGRSTSSWTGNCRCDRG